VVDGEGGFGGSGGGGEEKTWEREENGNGGGGRWRAAGMRSRWGCGAQGRGVSARVSAVATRGMCGERAGVGRGVLSRGERDRERGDGVVVIERRARRSRGCPTGRRCRVA